MVIFTSPLYFFNKYLLCVCVYQASLCMIKLRVIFSNLIGRNLICVICSRHIILKAQFILGRNGNVLSNYISSSNNKWNFAKLSRLGTHFRGPEQCSVQYCINLRIALRGVIYWRVAFRSIGESETDNDGRFTTYVFCIVHCTGTNHHRMLKLLLYRAKYVHVSKQVLNWENDNVRKQISWQKTIDKYKTSYSPFNIVQ